MNPTISVVIPAYNAADTLAHTLESLQRQSHPDWDAIVVDDGSTDRTAAVAADFSSRDPRIRLVRRRHQGVSAARDFGARTATADWLLFLDADDWISEIHLERMAAEVRAHPDLDAVHCAWARVTEAGEIYSRSAYDQTGDLFAPLTAACAFAIHACLFRRSLLEAVGGFDVSLRTCEDWDLWQRIARTGARFGYVAEVLSYYRMRPDSASVDYHRMLVDGLRVIERGHAPDPRVMRALARHRDGAPREELPDKRLLWACWCAALAIGHGDDPLELLAPLTADKTPSLEAWRVAQFIYYGVPLPGVRLLRDWPSLWPTSAPTIARFLERLETISTTNALARRASVILEGLIVSEALPNETPLRIGATYATRLEVTETIGDIAAPASTERLACLVTAEGSPLGALLLPVCDGLVPAVVIKDATAAQFAWTLLGRYLARSLYSRLTIEETPNKTLTIYRDGVVLGQGLAARDGEIDRLHNRIGWTVFLQELWGCPALTHADFYARDATAARNQVRRAAADRIVVEVSDPLADIETPECLVDVVVTVGGTAVGTCVATSGSRTISAQALRATITRKMGFELCRAAVREGLLGRPLTDAMSLRERLADAARRQQQHTGGSHHAGADLGVRSDTLLLGIRAPEPSGASGWRWAALPSTVTAELMHAPWFLPYSAAPGADAGPPGTSPQRLLCVPDTFIRHHVSWPRPSGSTKITDNPGLADPGSTGDHDRTASETTAPSTVDTDAVRARHMDDAFARLLPARSFGRGLQLTPPDPGLSALLAQRTQTLIVASDGAGPASGDRPPANVRAIDLDLAGDVAPGRFDLIVYSERWRINLSAEPRVAARTLARGLDPGGYLVVHDIEPTPVVTEHDATALGPRVRGPVAGELERCDLVRLVKHLDTGHGRYQLFRRRPLWRTAGIRLVRQGVALARSASAGNAIPATTSDISSMTSVSPAGSQSIPILMYHRVAPLGCAAMARWRVTPDAFDRQLRYLRDAGFHGLTLRELRKTLAARKSLPPRPVVLTFDDGFLDFSTYAWPQLSKYGFPAVAFLVTDYVGQSNAWDSAYGESVPLLDWSRVRQLHAEGVEFGSHSSTHRPLTALPHAEVAREAIRSRQAIAQRLNADVTAFAYPYGDVDPVVAHLLGACGYTLGLTCRSGAATADDALLTLPRIEICGTDSLDDFVHKLGPAATPP